jgi:cytochrome P450
MNCSYSIIGSAGFDYDFHSVESAGGQGDEVSTAFFNMMKTSTRLSSLDIIFFILQSIPGMGWISRVPTPRRQMILATHKILHRVSEKIIETKKREIKEEFAAQNLSEMDKSGYDAKAKDLLYLMIKANMATDVKASEKLDNAELLGQMTTLLLAGEL